MKLRTSLFNPAAFRKNITRFAPVWVLYTVGLFMVLSVCLSDGTEYYNASNLADSLSFMVAINLCYGFLNGQLLFGDLFNARHCNALHAMPLRRECWFATHIVSGLLFALVPNLVMSLIALPMLGGGWSVALWWLLAVNLQYLFFFGLAVCSALCVGNRFAMLLVYGIVNFFSLIVYWFYYSIYQPLLYGVHVTAEPFTLFCPTWVMMENYEMIEVTRRVVETSYQHYTYVKSVAPGEGWGYLAICAVLGAALLGIALLLYRRRKLESAGDFMAVRALEPVFLVLYTLSMAAFFQLFANLFGMVEYIFLALGLIIGFFTGRMLLMRTTKVFQPRGFMWFGILAAVFIGSMVLTWLDPLGITRYVPDTDDVASVKLSTSYNPEYGNEPYLDGDADIDMARQLHRLILDDEIMPAGDDEYEGYQTVGLSYVLDSGVTISRVYEVACSSPAGQLMGQYLSRPAVVLGTNDVDAFMARLDYMYYYIHETDTSGETYLYGENAALVRGLVEAILADCAEGTMAQSYGYHENDEEIGWISFELETADGLRNYAQVTVYESNRHTIAYLEENELPTEDLTYMK